MTPEEETQAWALVNQDSPRVGTTELLGRLEQALRAYDAERAERLRWTGIAAEHIPAFIAWLQEGPPKKKEARIVELGVYQLRIHGDDVRIYQKDPSDAWWDITDNTTWEPSRDAILGAFHAGQGRKGPPEKEWVITRRFKERPMWVSTREPNGISPVMLGGYPASPLTDADVEEVE